MSSCARRKKMGSDAYGKDVSEAVDKVKQLIETTIAASEMMKKKRKETAMDTCPLNMLKTVSALREMSKVSRFMMKTLYTRVFSRLKVLT